MTDSPEGQTQCRLVSYAPDRTTCTLNFDGEEHYYDEHATQYKILGYIHPNSLTIDRGAVKVYVVTEEGFDECTIAVYTKEALALTPESALREHYVAEKSENGLEWKFANTLHDLPVGTKLYALKP